MPAPSSIRYAATAALIINAMVAGEFARGMAPESTLAGIGLGTLAALFVALAVAVAISSARWPLQASRVAAVLVMICLVAVALVFNFVARSAMPKEDADAMTGFIVVLGAVQVGIFAAARRALATARPSVPGDAPTAS